MLYIGKKPEKPSAGKIILTVSAAIAGVAALTLVLYKLYERFFPTCIDCECEDFLDEDDIPEDRIEVECDEGATETEFEEH